MANKKHCVLGGTFTCVHRGHALLLAKCAKFEKITIGLTSDAYVKRHKIYPSFPYSKRLSSLKSALKKHGLLERTKIVKIESETERADSLHASAIIVSRETEGVAKKINEIRRRKKLPQLKIISVPLSYGENLKKISCQSVYFGKTDCNGNLRARLSIQAGTDNPTKLSGAGMALKRVFGANFRIRGHEEYSCVNAHPFNDETFTGAKNRAHAAWKRASGKCDYSLGIESGLFFMNGMHVDITICCVYDGKRETYGTGMGFVIPEWIAKRIRERGSDLSKVMSELAGIDKIGRKGGALGWFSFGKIHRREQVEDSVKCAFVPRLAEAKRGMEY